MASNATTWASFAPWSTASMLKKPWNIPRRRYIGHGHARGLELARVVLAFVAQRVHLRGDDARRWQPGMRRREVGGDAGVLARIVVGEVLPAVPLHLRGREEVAGRVVGLRRVVVACARRVDHRVHEQLEGDGWAFVARAQRDDRTEVAAGAVAGDRESRSGRCRARRRAPTPSTRPCTRRRLPPGTCARAPAGSRPRPPPTRSRWRAAGTRSSWVSRPQIVHPPPW